MTYDVNPEFNKAYWASMPPEIQKIDPLQGSERQSLAVSLAQRGFTIDGFIMVWDHEPWQTMRMRESLGFTWVPSFLQPDIQIIPGIIDWKHAPYDPNNPPVGSIKVSTNIADYPPFVTPVQPPAPPSGSYVGKLVYGNIYASLPGDPTPDGKEVTETRGTFLKHELLPGGPMSGESWYTLVTPAAQ